MRKSIHRPEYAPILAALVALRHEAGLTQAELAGRMRRTQGFVSSVELGDRRMDLLQVYDWCKGCGVRLTVLANRVDDALARDWSKVADKKVAPRKKAKRRTGRRLPRQRD